ncbi:hypothetical protein JW926_18265 [Candidatus Sumerlaeota bacterium]|nr:hypothetical protein [Candidatus Sumerlaeota bacterium]
MINKKIISGFFLFLMVCVFACLLYANDFFHTTTPLPIATQMYGAVVLGDYLYVIGGNSYIPGTLDDLWQTSVWRAFIYPDGSLEKWEKSTPLPANRCYIENLTIALNDVVYVVCGWNATSNVNCKTILWTRPLPNGELEPWRESPPYPGVGVSNSVAVSTPGYIHLLGGLGDPQSKSASSRARTPVKEAWSARVAPDGSVEKWESADPLPVPLWFHHAGVVGGKVWIWGGLRTTDNKSVNDTIYYSEILPSGRLGKWQTYEKKLNPAFFGAACSISGDYLLSFFPRYAGGKSNYDILFARYENNILSNWGLINAKTKAKMYTAVATDYRNKILFLPGGRSEHGANAAHLDSSVYCFRLKTDDAPTPQPTPDLMMSLAHGHGDQTARLSYTYHKITAGVHRGFHTYEQSRAIFEKKNKPVLIYFYTKTARNCVSQSKILQEQFNPAVYGDNIILAELDAQNYPQLSQQYGVFRFPAWVFFNSRGKEIGRKLQVLDASGLDSLIRYVIQNP